jgi:hypothetical protein
LDGSGYFFASSDDPQNGELIAAAVNALPALLDRLEAAERRVAELEGAARSILRLLSPRQGEKKWQAARDRLAAACGEQPGDA